jgi:hypothetical protein
MSQVSVNPYVELGTELPIGLAAIIGAIPFPATIENIVSQIETFIAGLGWLPGNHATTMEINNVARSVINSYVNGPIGNYGGAQMRIINMLTWPSFTSNLTVDSLSNRILDIEDFISKAGLPVQEQNPLFMATMVGQAAYTYWLAQIALGGGSSWNTNYFVPALTSATANVPYWVSAGMQGALIGAKSTMKGMIEQTTQIVTVQITSALIGALMLSAGRVIFKWIPRIGNGTGISLSGGGCGCGGH